MYDHTRELPAAALHAGGMERHELDPDNRMAIYVEHGTVQLRGFLGRRHVRAAYPIAQLGKARERARVALNGHPGLPVYRHAGTYFRAHPECADGFTTDRDHGVIYGPNVGETQEGHPYYYLHREAWSMGEHRCAYCGEAR